MLKEIKKADIILVITLVILGLGVSFFLGQNHQASTAVIITVDGEEQGTYDITEDRNIVLPVGNTVTIKDNSVYMSDSTCPGKDCIHRGRLTQHLLPLYAFHIEWLLRFKGVKANMIPSPNSSKAHFISYISLFTALAMIFAYIEALLPINIKEYPVPS